MNPDRRKAFVLGIILVMVAVVPVVTSSAYVLHVLILCGINIILAASNRLILRMGVWFLGQAAFYAVGVYAVLLGRQFLGISYWLALPLAGLTAALIALGIGYATARVKGVPFCIITVALVEVTRLTIVRLGGGRPVKCPAPEGPLGIDWSGKAEYYYLILLLVLVVLILLYLIEHSRFGRNAEVMAESETLAESLGINTVRHRVLIMSACCFCAGLAGGFFAPYVRVVGYTTFTLTTSIVILIYVVVGGTQSMWGAVLGAVFLTVLPEFLPGRAAIQNIIYAAIVLVSLFFLPGGLISLPEVIRQRKLTPLPQMIRSRRTGGSGTGE